MLFYDEKLKQIQDAQKQTQALSTQALQKLNDNAIQAAISQQFDNLASNLSTRIDSNLQTKKDELQNQAQNLTNELKNEIKKEVSTKAHEYFTPETIQTLINKETLQEQAKDTFLQNNSDSMQNKIVNAAKKHISISSITNEVRKDVRNQIDENQIANDLRIDLQAKISQSVDENLQTLAIQVKEQAVKKIAQNYKGAEFKNAVVQQIRDDFKTSDEFETLKQDTAHQVANYIASNENLEQSLKEVNAQIAQQIYTDTLAKDELVKMRLDTMLYLQALRLTGFEKQIIDITSAMMRPSRTRQNIIVTR